MKKLKTRRRLPEILAGAVFAATALITWLWLETNRPVSLTNQSPTKEVQSSTNQEKAVGEIPSQESYQIALYGDSMQDSMQEHMGLLTTTLEEKYPQTAFTIYNYGIGAQNAETALARFENTFSNRGRNYPAITAVQPDIIIIGSFAYNPFNPPSIARHTAALRTLIQKAWQVTDQVYLLVEIAPLREGFAQGPKGVSFSPEQAIENSQNVIDQLENAVAVGQSMGAPIINVYQASIKTSENKEGFRKYVNSDDGIHPSAQGYALIAEKIVETMNLP